MKKKYIRPTLDVVASQLNVHLMHSYDWAQTKGIDFDNEDPNGEEGQVQPKNLWDD